MELVDQVARYMWNQLLPLVARHPNVIEDVRGAGLLLGVKLRSPNGEMMTRLRDDHKLLTVVAAENVLRLLPPLTIDKTHVDEAVAAIDAAAAGVARHAA